MSLKYDLEIDVSGADQHDRTSFIAFLSKLLALTDEKVIIQHADPEIDDKLPMSAEDLRERLSGKTIFVREIMHETTWGPSPRPSRRRRPGSRSAC